MADSTKLSEDMPEGLLDPYAGDGSDDEFPTPAELRRAERIRQMHDGVEIWKIVPPERLALAASLYTDRPDKFALLMAHCEGWWRDRPRDEW